jgi:5-hydroxyisourate hydrolase
MARLSTHVLDTSRGTPAVGVAIELCVLQNGRRHSIVKTATNADGRTTEPLLEGVAIQTGLYELTFQAGDYFRRMGVPLSTPPFLDEIVVRFHVADPHGNYHVPLLVAPYAYSTYRGS